jgi:hypothetical protein
MAVRIYLMANTPNKQYNAQNRLLPRVPYGEHYLHVVSWDEG